MANGTISVGEKSNKVIFERVFRIAWAATVIYMFVWPMTNNSALMRLIWIPSMLLIFLVSIPALLSKRLLYEMLVPVTIMFMTILINDNARNSAHLFAAFSYISMFMLISICAKTRPTKKTFDFIFYVNIILSILFTIYSFTPIAYRVHREGFVWYAIYYVFDLGNSNFAAMVLFSLYCILIINLSYRKHRLPIMILAAYVFYMIYRTNCRSVIMSAVLVVLAYVFIGRRKIPKLFVFLGCMAPMLFISVYLALFRRFGSDGIRFLGKSLFSGRQIVFSNYLNMLYDWKYILFGNYAEAGLQNAHNSILSIFASLGIIGVISFYSFYLRVVGELQRKDTSPIRTMCIVCILALFVQSSMEASYFLGGFPGIMFLSSFARDIGQRNKKSKCTIY